MTLVVSKAQLVGAVALPVIMDETGADVRDREALLDAAFGPTRFAKTCQRLRRGQRPAQNLALVAKRGATLVGTLRLWHVMAGDVPALLLGPRAVAQSVRSYGLGGRLMTCALERARDDGHGAVVLVGDPEYYARFGFSRALAENLALPGPVETRRFLGLELQPGALAAASGLVRATAGVASVPRDPPTFARAA
jgi:predicted N-acetyltransferase YhbS